MLTQIYRDNLKEKNNSNTIDIRDGCYRTKKSFVALYELN